MASKPDKMQDKQAAQLQEPVTLQGKCATGTRTGQRNGGGRRAEFGKAGLHCSALIHSKHNTHKRLLTHTEHTSHYTCIVPVLTVAWTPLGPAPRARTHLWRKRRQRRGDRRLLFMAAAD